MLGDGLLDIRAIVADNDFNRSTQQPTLFIDLLYAQFIPFGMF